MRHHRVLSGAAVLAVLFVAGCSADAEDDVAAPPAAVTSSAAVAPADASADPSAGPTGAVTPAPSGATATTPPGGPRSNSASTKGGVVRTPNRAVVTTDGVGPYQVAMTTAELTSAGLLGTVDTSAGCPDFVVAKGLPAYHTPALVFFKGKLQYVSVTSGASPTDEGATIGMTLAEVKQKHPAGKQLSDWNGGTGWFAQTDANALLFRFKNGKLETIEAGLAEPLQFRFTDGEGC
jgi:hypothetical protein